MECASDWAGAPCRWTTTYGCANAIERPWAGLGSNLRKPGLRPVAGVLSHPSQQADCARTNSQSALCRRCSHAEGRSEETTGLPNWHTGVGRPSQGGAYRSRRSRYALVREPRRRGAVEAHQRQWGVADGLVADHRPGSSRYSLCRHAPGRDLSLAKWGTQWEKLAVEVARECSIGIPFVTSVIVDPDDHRMVWAGVEIDGVFRSLDGGDTWRRLNHDPLDLIEVDLAVPACPVGC
jgi:hypothetical protein